MFYGYTDKIDLTVKCRISDKFHLNNHFKKSFYIGVSLKYRFRNGTLLQLIYSILILHTKNILSSQSVGFYEMDLMYPYLN